MLRAWRAIGARGAKEDARLEGAGSRKAGDSGRSGARAARRRRPRAPDVAAAIARGARRRSRPTTTKRATRVWSQMALEHLVPALPELIGGSADLTGSNGTKHQGTTRRSSTRQLRRQLHPLRRARARHGRGHERHRAVRRAHPLWRHVSRVHGLLPPVDPPVGADAPARDLRHDARLASASARTARRTSRSSIWRPCAPFRNLLVLRPADGVETAECWEIALAARGEPVDPGAVAPGGATNAAHRARRRRT